MRFWELFSRETRFMLTDVPNTRQEVLGVSVVSALPTQQYRLTTAEIIYRLPDHPLLLQTFIWQKFDIAPEFPVLHKFLKFWRDNLDGELYAVRVGQGRATRPPLPLIILPESDTRH
jgi:uncharacterized protein Usg